MLASLLYGKGLNVVFLEAVTSRDTKCALGRIKPKCL
jgi:hypothetical protein